MHVVATAGHVDHGKSTLVRALTGSEPDRLAEERRRGLSIELGYCWTSLPGVGDVAFVDVPGHQRFISTTLSGIGPVPVAMFVVAADDPWMPQAEEHLRALDALGVGHGVLVVTRSDLADPGPALARARQQLEHTSLRGAPAVVVSGRTGAGIEQLRSELTRVLHTLPCPDPSGAVRLWVDRRFAVRGIGAVVTGTLPAGTISVGDSLAWGDTLLRVRGMECLGGPVDHAEGSARVALDLGGRAPVGLGAGSVLVTPDAFEPTRAVDVLLTGEGRVPEQPVLHVGTRSVTVRVRPLDESNVRLTLADALPLRIGDRALLRDPGSRSIWGVRVLDPAPPPLRRRGAAAARALLLAGADDSVAFALSTRPVVRRSELSRRGVALTDLPTGALASGDWLVSADRARHWRQQLADLVAAHTSALEPGVSVAQVIHELRLPDPALAGLLVEPPLRLAQGRVVPDVEDVLPASLRTAVSAVQEDLADSAFRAPDAGRLKTLGLDARVVAALHRSGHLLRLAEGIVLLPGADDAATEILRRLPQPFSASAARQCLDTSRRVVLPLLSHLDRTGRTLRLPDDRRQVRDA